MTMSSTIGMTSANRREADAPDLWEGKPDPNHRVRLTPSAGLKELMIWGLAPRSYRYFQIHMESGKALLKRMKMFHGKHQWPDRNARGTNLTAKYKVPTRCPRYRRDMTSDLERHNPHNRKMDRPLDTGC